MDANTITTLIGTVGFPIVAFLLMYNMCNQTLEKITTSLNDLKSAIDVLNERTKQNEG